MVDVMNPVSSHCGSYFGPAQQSSAFSGRTAAGGSGSVASECVSPEPSPLGTSASTLSPSSTLGQTTSNTNGSGSYFKEASTNKYRQLFLNYKARDHEKMIRTSRLGELPAKPISNGFSSSLPHQHVQDNGFQNQNEASSSSFLCSPTSSVNGAAEIRPIPPSQAENDLWTNSEPKFDQVSSLDDLLRTSNPEGLLRNVSMGAAASTGFNDSFPTFSTSGNVVDGGSMGFAGINTNVSSNATTQTGNTDENQAALDALIGGTGLGYNGQDSEFVMKAMLTMLGPDIAEADGAASSSWGRPPVVDSGHQQQQLQGASNVETNFMAEGGHNGASFYPASPPNTMAMSQGYPAYMSLASAVRQPYTPQVNHSYAMPSANQQLQQQLQDDLETASHASGTSGRSRDFSFDSGSIKQDPDGESRIRHSRDERKARDLGVPFSIQDIVNLPMDEFNDMLSRHELNEEQLNLCRDIRRRGKNKVAAQNCRKRKIDQIQQLEKDVKLFRQRRQRLMDERIQLHRQRQLWRETVGEVEEELLDKMHKDSKEFRLDLTASGVRIARRSVGMGGAAAGASSIATNENSRANAKYQASWKGHGAAGKGTR